MPTAFRAKRRLCIKIVAAAPTIATSLIGLVLCASAAAAGLVSETDPAAMKLKYKADATKARERQDAKAFCDNCAYYTGKDGAASGACAALGDRTVAAKGWCTAWESY
jgi:hypothetical protein